MTPPIIGLVWFDECSATVVMGVVDDVAEDEVDKAERDDGEALNERAVPANGELDDDDEPEEEAAMGSASEVTVGAGVNRR